MADQDNTPVFQIQRMYLKDLSLEQPNSPQILLEQQQPQVDIAELAQQGHISYLHELSTVMRHMVLHESLVSTQNRPIIAHY